MSSFMGAIAIADLVKTTLGPKGMDKILQSVSSLALCACTCSAHRRGSWGTPLLLFCAHAPPPHLPLPRSPTPLVTS